MPANKIKTQTSLKKLIVSHKRAGKKIAFTNGCFDILHYGHVKYLEKSKSLADILIVALNSDSSVKALKGPERPIVALKNRMGVIAALESVDYVTSFKEATPAKIITFLKPDMVVKGGDYKLNNIVGKNIVTSYGGSVKSISFEKGHSVTSLIKKIAKKYRG